MMQIGQIDARSLFAVPSVHPPQKYARELRSVLRFLALAAR
jgi:hypothetical protein